MFWVVYSRNGNYQNSFPVFGKTKLENRHGRETCQEKVYPGGRHWIVKRITLLKSLQMDRIHLGSGHFYYMVTEKFAKKIFICQAYVVHMEVHI